MFNSLLKKRERISVLFIQFNPLRASLYLLIDILRKLLDPYCISSYSQTGEDRIIQAIIENKKGFFVDVGCNHPQKGSNTFELYKCGWTGINIDASEDLININKRIRKNDISTREVVSDKEELVEFIEFDDPFVSSISKQHVMCWEKLRKIKEKQSIKAVQLTNILDKYNVPFVFDLLSIDVEGHDYEVLTSLNLNRYRPKLIVIEMHNFDITMHGSSPIVSHLKNKGYKMIGFVVMNGYFLDENI